MRDEDLTKSLLRWYDAHARELPWRIPPGGPGRHHAPDPYRVWLSEVMLQQTTVPAVKGYFLRFTELWPDVQSLARADDDRVMAEWAGLGYYARARNLLKCARQVVDQHGGQFPDTFDGLLSLPGIGPYTAAAIAAIAFNEPCAVVDGNVERVLTRCFAIRDRLDLAKPEIRKLAAALTPDHRPGDHAQAMMDLGATICTPRSPNCAACPWREDCKGRALGIAAQLPYRKPKSTRPTRHGLAYLARRDDGAWLLERRPDSGLLGGMLGWPGSEWADIAKERPPLDASWSDPGMEVRHTFTHFHLRLGVRVARVGMEARPVTGQFVPAREFRRSDLPTVMRKAFDIACAHLQED